MKVVFHEDFYDVYTSDPASSSGRMEAIVKVIESKVTFVEAVPATEEDIKAVHTESHIEYVRNNYVYPISALAAGGAIQAAEIGMTEPCFGLIRPPGHHASSDASWGFCYFNNMAIALEALRRKGMITTAFVLDFDLHYGDGNVNILEPLGYADIFNPDNPVRSVYLDEVTERLETCEADVIAISAGFDNHERDWGSVLKTEDYYDMGKMARQAARRCHGGCFAILEGGYNHNILGYNVMALLEGMSEQ